MIPHAMPPMTDDELLALTARLLAVLEGLPLSAHRCTCGRVYRLGIVYELQALIVDISRALLQRGTKVPNPVQSRFQLLETD
jgi:hypothetical protein